MRIGNQIPRSGETLDAKTASQQTTKDSGQASSPVNPDQAAALNRGDLLAKALTAERQGRLQRVEALTLQLEAGTYAVDSTELGHALLEDWLASTGGD
jgi:anti-sigma28 factor (negative regulator of flagellin synthesis)